MRNEEHRLTGEKKEAEKATSAQSSLCFPRNRGHPRSERACVGHSGWAAAGGDPLSCPLLPPVRPCGGDVASEQLGKQLSVLTGEPVAAQDSILALPDRKLTAGEGDF